MVRPRRGALHGALHGALRGVLHGPCPGVLHGALRAFTGPTTGPALGPFTASVPAWDGSLGPLGEGGRLRLDLEATRGPARKVREPRGFATPLGGEVSPFRWEQPCLGGSRPGNAREGPRTARLPHAPRGRGATVPMGAAVPRWEPPREP